MSNWRPEKIISGGQTGADIGGLVGAERANIATGGMAPKDYKTEKGPQPEVLRDRFGLTEHASLNYKDRTLENLRAAEATLIFATLPTSNGTTLTIIFCEDENKPYCLVDPGANDPVTIIRDFLNREKPKILNIAGNRESVSPGLAAQVAGIVGKVFGND